MRKSIILSTSIILLFQNCMSEAPSRDGSVVSTHGAWTFLLQKYVDNAGNVDYEGFQKDITSLNYYLNQLSANPPDEKTWSDSEQIAYWINVYNAFTIKLIIQHYPVESIKDIGSKIQIPFINSPWDIKFIEINTKKLDLNNIEHSILRKKYNEPRIHFAINCASFSCPKLRNEAFIAGKLDDQLEEQAFEFINDPARNNISTERASLSKIFSWFKGDFTKKESLASFINQYSTTKIKKDTKVAFIDYDWSLNIQR